MRYSRAIFARFVRQRSALAGTTATSIEEPAPWLRPFERLWRRLWPLCVAANVVAAFTLAFKPGDLETVRGWGHALLFDRANLYTPFFWCDYPPNAMIALAPLAWLPDAHAPWIWALVNIELAIVLPLLVAIAMQRQHRKRELMIIASTFWCWSGTHSLLQFTLLAMAFGVASWATAARRPGVSGLLLGFALMKPQIAAPFVLWSVLTRRWRVLATAASTVIASVLLYCVVSRTGPVTVATGYLNVIRDLYTGATTLPGVSDLRPLVLLLVPASSVDLVANALALALLGVLGVVGWRMRLRGDGEMRGFVGLACAWALLTFRQLSYGLVLLLPLSAWLGFGTDGMLSKRERAWGFWLLQAVLVVDVPTYFRRVEQVAPVLAPVGRWLAHFDRFYLLIFFAALTWLMTASTASRREETATSIAA